MNRLAPPTLLLLVAGCTGGLHSSAPPTQTYILRAAPAAAGLAPTGTSLQLARITTSPGLGSDRIVLVESDHRMSFFAASRWAAEVPDLVETLAVATLRGTGGWDAVHEFPSSFGSDFLLQIAIRRFEADYTRDAGNPTVQVTLDCTVIRRSGREPLANFVAEGATEAGQNRMASVVAAFEKSVNAALASMAQRTAEIVTSAQVAGAPALESR